MNMDITKIFRYVFVFLCFFTTLSMCIYWGYKFFLDEDLSVIKYIKFHEKENDQHPTVSFCLQDPFLRQSLEKHGVTPALYLKYLRGEYISEEMLKINYSNVTIDISEHIKGYRMFFRNGTTIKFDSGLRLEEKKMLTSDPINFFGAIGSRFWKCFPLNIPKIKDVEIFRILLSNTIFPNGYRPTYAGFKVVYHRNQQFFLAGHNEKWVWSYRASNESYKMRIFYGSVTTMKHRSKPDFRCIESIDEYDNWVLRRHTNETKCNLPYLDLDEKFPMCDTKELIKKGLLDDRIVEKRQMDKPCTTMKYIEVQHLESSFETPIGEKFGVFWFSLQFTQPEFKEIEQKRYCKQSKNILLNVS